MADIKFNWKEIDSIISTCNIFDFVLYIQNYGALTNDPDEFYVALKLYGVDNTEAIIAEKDLINTLDEAKKIAESIFLKYWAKLKSEVENGGHKI